jgi:thiol-disulfide isomerase/thioredoxin
MRDRAVMLSALDRAPVWLNSEPLTAEALRGRVVLVDFWTYTCVNWLRTLPYVSAWAERYRDRGLVVVGAHAPEFGFEHDLVNVRRAVAELGVDYPVVIDNDFAIWRSFDNHYWPAVYLVDGDGSVRFHHFGEEAYEQTERAVQELLGVDEAVVTVDAGGLAAAADWDSLRSPETYIGYARGERRTDLRADDLALNQWALAGAWAVDEEFAVLEAAPGSVAYSFEARDLNLVLTPPGDAHPLHRAPRRRAARRRSRARRRRVRSGSARRAADVPARPPARADPPADVRDHLPRTGRGRLRLHVRVGRITGEAAVTYAGAARSGRARGSTSRSSRPSFTPPAGPRS